MTQKTTSLDKPLVRSSAVARFWDSTLGKKVVMAVTGVIMIAFLIAHVLGNFAIFQGPEALNAYSAFLHGQAAGLLWLVRIVLVLSLFFHVLAASQLMSISRGARQKGYARQNHRAATLASLSMRLSGLLIAAFIVFHILHLSTGSIQPVPFDAPNVYANVVGGFRVPWVAGLYLVSMLFVGLHVFHGAFAYFRTLGLRRRSNRSLSKPIAVVVAVFVWLGFTIIPLAVMTNRVQ